MIRLLLVLATASAVAPRLRLSRSSPRALVPTGSTNLLVRAHNSLRSWIDGERADTVLAKALCAARARELLRVVQHERASTESLELALDVVFDLTTSDREALPMMCALERRYDGHADLTSLAYYPLATISDNASTSAPRNNVEHSAALVGRAHLDDRADEVSTFSDIIAVGVRRLGRTVRDVAIHGFALDGTFVLSESPLRCLGPREVSERGDGSSCGNDANATALLCCDGTSLVCFADAKAADGQARALFGASQRGGGGASHSVAARGATTDAATAARGATEARRLEEEDAVASAWAGEDRLSEHVVGNKTILIVFECLANNDCSSFDAAFGHDSRCALL